MTGTFDQGNPLDDQAMLSEGIVESQASFEEAITIKRFASQSKTTDALGHAPAPTYTTFPATAVVVEMGVDRHLYVAGVLSAGDLHLQMRERLRESDLNNGGSNPGDRVIYRGAEYRLIMRPVPVVVGDVAFYNTFLRRTNSTGDTAGL